MRIGKLTRRFLLVVLGLFVVVAAVSSLFLFLQVRGIVRELGRGYAVERAEAARSRVAHALQQEATLASKLADSPTIERWFLAEDNERLRETAMAELESYRRAFMDSNYFVIVDESKRYYNKPADGELAITTLHRDAPGDQWYFKQIQAEKDVSFNLDYDSFMGVSNVWINCLVRRSGEIIGMAGTGLNIGGVIKRLVNAEGEGTRSILIDDDGAITAHPDISIMRHNANVEDEAKKTTIFDLAGSSRDRATLERLMQGARSGRTAVEAVSLEGSSSLTAITTIPRIGWMMVATVDASSFVGLSDFAPLFVLLLVSLLIVLAVIAVLMERIVLTPLTAMTASANRIAEGDYDALLSVRRKDEIGTLSLAFNTMAAEVKRHTENLQNLVDQRTAELRTANEHLETANRQVAESIRYAGMIQDSVMVTESELSERFSSYSLFHRQRDTVGGDFLYVRDVEQGFLVAVIDCEGHGVSGALMTMMSNSFLQLITSRPAAHDPASILNELDQEIASSLRRKGDRLSTHRGLDIGLCACFPEAGEAVFAGAGMPLYVLEPDRSISVIRGRTKAIGYAHRKQPQPFENHRFATADRAFCMVTDGYVDQAGGDSGRAYGTKRLFSMLSRCDPGDLYRNGPQWQKEFEGHRGSYEQRDDVLALAFSV